MADLAVIAVMLASTLLPFGGMSVLVLRGHSGWALCFASVTGAVLAILLYASGRPFGIDPVFAMGAALLVFLPALLGCVAGGWLGWLIRKRDDRWLK